MKTVEELRKATAKEVSTQIDAFDIFYDQITVDDAIEEANDDKKE